MFRFLKAKKHKGITEVILSDLGHVNVICGKNNSGKTSILEALNSERKFGIGKRVDSQEWLEELFEPLCKNLSYPSPRVSKEWFSKYISNVVQNDTIWYDDEKVEIIEDMVKSQKNHEELKNYSEESFDFKSMLERFFRKTVSNYKTILIPPKRNLEYDIRIDPDQNITPWGEGITNRLFLLKNQEPHSPEHKTYEKIYNAFNQITNYDFDIIIREKSNNITIKFRKGDGDWIEGKSCGLGLSDVLIMVTFALDFDYTFIFIEEPESHLHPEFQKRFLAFIKSIKSRQFIFSTHSNVFLDPYVVDKIFYTEFENNVKVSDETSKSEILYNLGYSVADNLVADMVVLVEGPTTIPILRTIFNWMEFGEKFNMRFWPLGGDIMADLDLSVLLKGKML